MVSTSPGFAVALTALAAGAVGSVVCGEEDWAAILITELRHRQTADILKLGFLMTSTVIPRVKTVNERRNKGCDSSLTRAQEAEHGLNGGSSPFVDRWHFEIENHIESHGDTLLQPGLPTAH